MSAPGTSNRRLVWLVLLALGLWYFKDSFVNDAPPARKPVAKPVATTNTARNLHLAPPEDVCTIPTTMPVRQALVAKARANPFMAPPPPPVKLPKPIKTVAPVAVTPPAPVAPPLPRLPFTYLGQFVDPGRPTTVFLTTGNALINASPGDTIEGGFRLESIGPKELVFLHVASNTTLRMPIEGERL